jgi:hypothetical protein
VTLRILKVVIYGLITSVGLGLVYGRISAAVRGGADGALEGLLIVAWAVLGLYLISYAFLLAARTATGRPYLVHFDVAALCAFCLALVGRMLGV